MKLSKLFFLVLVMAFLLPSNAHAYIDPGSGAFVLQMLLAAFFGLCFYVRKTRNWIIGCLKKIIGCIGCIKKNNREKQE